MRVLQYKKELLKLFHLYTVTLQLDFIT